MIGANMICPHDHACCDRADTTHEHHYAPDDCPICADVAEPDDGED